MVNQTTRARRVNRAESRNMKLYYFTDTDGDNIMNDHHGNIRGARKKAEQYAAKHKTDVYINLMDGDVDQIVDVIFGDD